MIGFRRGPGLLFLRMTAAAGHDPCIESRFRALAAIHIRNTAGGGAGGVRGGKLIVCFAPPYAAVLLSSHILSRTHSTWPKCNTAARVTAFAQKALGCRTRCCFTLCPTSRLVVFVRCCCICCGFAPVRRVGLTGMAWRLSRRRRRRGGDGRQFRSREFYVSHEHNPVVS